MKLQILVPRYNEPVDIIKPLLGSIVLQQNVNFNEIGVIISDDGSEEKFSDDLFKDYPFEVKYIWNEHKGVSAARQACLNEANAEYVMFADIDDMMINLAGLWIVFREINNGGFDLLISKFIEETRTREGEIRYIDHNNDYTFVHGKIFNRSWLYDNELFWDTSLTVHEDGYFISLAREVVDPKKAKYCPTAFYLWKWNSNSICRRDPKYYILETYPNMLDSNTALVRQLIRRGKEDRAQYYIATMIFDAYYSMNCDDFLNYDNHTYREKVENKFREYYLEFSELFNSLDIKERNMIGSGVRSKMVREGMNYEVVTFDSWISQIQEVIS